MHLSFTNSQRVAYTKILVCLSMLSIIAISYKVWLNERNYPLAPVFDFIPALPAPFDWVQLVLLAGLLVVIIFSSNPVFISTYFILFLLLALGDQNRLQPYNYMFAFMLLVISLKKKALNGEREVFVLNCLRLILIGTYLWSGIHTLNMHFVDRFYPFFARSDYNTLPGFEPGDFLRKYMVLIIPLAPMLIAVGLMINRSRRLSLHLVVLMHFAIMIFLSPLGFGWNLVVIPWNAALIGINILLFWKVDDIRLQQLWSPQGSLVKGVVMVLFLVMPLFNFFGLWDHYLSSSTYSFKTPYAKIYVDENLKQKLPAYLEPYYHTNDKGTFIETTYWALGELNIMPYPQKRVYEKLRDAVCAFDDRQPCKAQLELY